MAQALRTLLLTADAVPADAVSAAKAIAAIMIDERRDAEVLVIAQFLVLDEWKLPGLRREQIGKI